MSSLHWTNLPCKSRTQQSDKIFVLPWWSNSSLPSQIQVCKHFVIQDRISDSWFMKTKLWWVLIWLSAHSLIIWFLNFWLRWLICWSINWLVLWLIHWFLLCFFYIFQLLPIWGCHSMLSPSTVLSLPHLPLPPYSPCMPLKNSNYLPLGLPFLIFPIPAM